MGANPEARRGVAGAGPGDGGLGAISGPPGRSDVTTVIVSWNTREHLARCLAALQDAAEGLRVETIVVDNGSTDGSQAMVAEKFPRARLIQSRDNVGFGRASNAGAAAGAGRTILMLNSDCELAPGARTAFEAVNGFDERFFMYMEDVDLCARLGAAGFRLRYVPHAVAVHHWGASTARSPGRMLRHAYLSRVAYLDKHFPGWGGGVAGA